ncbi:MAG: ATPase inhibitor subunit zeta [Hyphomicrobiales bacterium]
MLPNQLIEPQEIEAITDGCVNARRDYILGLWAGSQMGLCGDELQLYVRDVIYTDRVTPGAGPMIKKVARDFSKCGVALANNQISVAFQNAERTARIEMLVTD